MAQNLPTSYSSLDYPDVSAPTRADARRTLLIASLVTMALWFVPYANYILYPLRLFVTFIHEAGHALAALASGGSVVSLTIAPDGSGLTQAMQNPAFAWLTLSGGYLGTAVFGAILLQVGRLRGWRNAGRATLYAAGIFLFLITLMWGWRSVFTMVTGLSLGLLLFGMGRFLSPRAADFVAGFLAVQCCLNALGDLQILFHLTTQGMAHNDAAFMAQRYGLSPIFWSVFWGLSAVAILIVALRSYWRGTASATRT
jgi:hypothetical protein